MRACVCVCVPYTSTDPHSFDTKFLHKVSRAAGKTSLKSRFISFSGRFYLRIARMQSNICVGWLVCVCVCVCVCVTVSHALLSNCFGHVYPTYHTHFMRKQH